jgi:hypothetical protein
VSDVNLRRLFAVLGTLSVLGSALLPVEHVHRSRTQGGHHSDVVHRHLESHHPTSKATIDHEDGGIQWLDSPFANPTWESHADPHIQVPNDPVPTPRPEPTRGRARRAIRVSVHDPPWTSENGLRAPPSVSL